MNKYLARCGVASRRHADELIAAGRVSVNGQPCLDFSCSVDAARDAVCVDGQPVQPPAAQAVTLLLHKPAGYVTTMSDPQGRATVAELVPTERFPGLYPVGRLDRDTTGLLLFSTDGNLGNGLLHPRYAIYKTYYALIDAPLDDALLRRLRAGVRLNDGMTQPAEVEVCTGAAAEQAARLVGRDALASGYAQGHGGKRARAVAERNGCYVKLRIREGRNRQVRRMFQAVGHQVVALHRQEFGPLGLGTMERGRWRLLSQAETDELYRVAGVVSARG